MQIDAEYRLAGLFGYPVRASLSPLLHNQAFATLGIKAVYLAFEISPHRLDEAIRGMKAMNFLGANVTVPYKETVIGLLDRLSEGAALAGAVNTIKVEGEELIGYNTDGPGFIKSLYEEADFHLEGKRILIIGAGGAARGISLSLALEGAKEIRVVNRTQKRAEILANHLRRGLSWEGISVAPMERLSDPSFVNSSDLVINTTPPEAHFPFKFGALEKAALVCDLAYREEGTPFLAEARRAGLRTMDGRAMLINQAALSFQIWTGLPPPFSLMRDTLDKTCR